MDNLDLNIENYDLNDLLNLFSLDTNFSEEDLKRCKRTVCKTHPDKCKLPKEYFIFFVKAYKYIHHIYEFKRNNVDNKTTEYQHHLDTFDNSNKDEISNKIKSDNFNKWFNEMFLKYKLEDNDDGYGEWLASEDKQDNIKCNKSNLNNNFEMLKSRKIKDMIVYSDINDVCNGISTGESELVSSKGNYSNGDIFSKTLNPDEIGGHIGDMINLENALSFKKLFAALKINNLEFRERKFYINSSEKSNYIFNSSIKGIEQSDLILLIGTNPRHEATMLNARIRKVFAQKKVPIYSIGNPGDLTYDYTIIGNKTDDIKKILSNDSNFSKILSSSKKPVIIIGESALELKSGKYLIEGFKKFLKNNNFINKDWNAFNFLPQNASTVGLIDLKILSKEEDKRNSFFEKLKNNQFKLLYLLGSDNLDIKKNNEFIVYQGSHGDRGAEIADLILPSAAFTEQNGLYENLEGRVQECKKASYPIGEALEDWKILNLLLKALGKNENLLNFDSLRKEVLKSIPNFSKLNELPYFKDCELINTSPYFESEEVNIKELDYFFTNAISRASKTMSECRQIKYSSKKTGTDNL